MTIYLRLNVLDLPAGSPKPQIYAVGIMLKDKKAQIIPQRVQNLPRTISLKQKLIKFEAPLGTVPILYLAVEETIFAKYPIPTYSFSSHNLTIENAKFTFLALDDNQYTIYFDAFYQTDEKYKPFSSSRKAKFLDDQINSTLLLLYQQDDFFKNAMDRKTKREEESPTKTKSKPSKSHKHKQELKTPQSPQYAGINTALTRMNKGQTTATTSFGSNPTNYSSDQTPNLNRNALSLIQSKPEYNNLIFSSIVSNFANCDETLAHMLSDPDFIKEVFQKMTANKPPQ